MKIAVQLYTLREELAADTLGGLARLAEIGYRHVEVAGTYGMSPERFRGLLDAAGLAAIGMHVGLTELETDPQRVADEARVLGCDFVILPWISREDYRSGWPDFAGRLREIGERMFEFGLRFAYHNHDFEFERSGGRTGWHELWDSLAGSRVQAEVDVYWVTAGGHDPASEIRRLAGRVPLIHFKDMSEGDPPRFVPVGEGRLDWPGIIAACREAGTEWAVVELDTCPRDAFDCVESARRALLELGLAAG